MRLGSTSLSVTRPLGLRYRFLGLGTFFLSSASSVDEGDSLTVNINTVGVPSGTVVYWQTTNITTSDSDFTATSGSAQIVNGAGGFTIPVAADSTTEGAETFGITLRRFSQNGPIVASTTNKTINDTSLSASYSASSPSSVNEGSALVCTVTTTNVADSTTLYWTTSHTSTTDADFTANNGSFTINSNSGTFNVTPSADATTEGAETFTVQIRTGSVSGTIVATLPSVTVNDTSLTPTYSFSSASSVDEGASLACTVTTANVADSTTLYWTINHTTTSAADFTSTSGSFTVTSNSGTFSIPVASDTLTSEGAETFTVEIRTGSTSGTIVETSSSITVNDVAGWDLNNATYSQTSTSTLTTSGWGFTFAGNGTKVYVTRSNYSSTQIWQYSLATAWDISSTISYERQLSLTQDHGQSIKWKPDGTKFFLIDRDEDRLKQFTVSTAWDVNGATGGGIQDLSTYDGQTRDLAFSSDGTKVFVIGSQNDKVHSFTLSTAWDITSTFTYVASSSVLPFNGVTMDMRPDGTSFYFGAGLNIHQYDPTTAFDVTTFPSSATYSVNTSSVHSSGNVQAAYIKPDGSKLFTYNDNNGKIIEYDL